MLDVRSATTLTAASSAVVSVSRSVPALLTLALLFLIIFLPKMMLAWAEIIRAKGEAGPPRVIRKRRIGTSPPVRRKRVKGPVGPGFEANRASQADRAGNDAA